MSGRRAAPTTGRSSGAPDPGPHRQPGDRAVHAELGAGDVRRGLAEDLLTGPTSDRTASTLAIEPVGVKSAASLPNISATRSRGTRTVGSSPYTSSPTSAAALRAASAVGVVRGRCAGRSRHAAYVGRRCSRPSRACASSASDRERPRRRRAVMDPVRSTSRSSDHVDDAVRGAGAAVTAIVGSSAVSPTRRHHHGVDFDGLVSVGPAREVARRPEPSAAEARRPSEITAVEADVASPGCPWRHDEGGQSRGEGGRGPRGR